ncbi:NADPH-dependent FMN reductase [Sphingobacterium bovistauri]|uniref:NAD(P)H-dependent oxidoreductase n=1 Tax=Sphingobacterium bovistauri TaxID=2781959 RepID=A0ABS7Z6A9_9SPHI|nr:NAD(P)H-dependent oxidoreductase [Sphingobacterium bovistauri]MCA5005728.1 NAD(P)H-dependent oxidoreductase [Sphingobacterium bovistauri]
MNLIISGTNRLGSNSLKVANYYKEELLRRSEPWEIFSLEDLPHDILFTDLYGKRSDTFARIQAKVSEARKFIFIIPEYNGSYPGVLKSFVDACSYPTSFHHKKAALVGVSNGKYGNIRGVDHFTGVCNYMRMHVLPLKIHIAHVQNELNSDGLFIDPITINFINEQIEEIVRY